MGRRSIRLSVQTEWRITAPSLIRWMKSVSRACGTRYKHRRARHARPVALGRTNALFAGADSGGKHWAMVATLIQTAKLNNVEPLAWLTDVLKRIVSRRDLS
jgi:hypothetical protein